MSTREGTTNHEIFTRLGEAEVSIGRIETELNSLGRQFAHLAESVDSKVGGLQSMIHSIDSKLSGAGKMTGAQFAGLAASLVGAVAVAASILVAPLSRDIAALKETVIFSNTIGEKALEGLDRRLSNHAHPDQAEAVARLDERVTANRDLLRAESQRDIALAWIDAWKLLQEKRP